MPTTLSLNDASRALGKKPDTLKKWFSLGCPHGRDGKNYAVNIAEVFDWRVQHEKSLIMGNSDGEVLVLEVERAKLAREQRIGQELTNAEKKGRLIDAEAAAEKWSRMILAARAKLLAMPARIAAKTSHPNPRKLSKEIDAEVRSALNELADAGPE